MGRFSESRSTFQIKPFTVTLAFLLKAFSIWIHIRTVILRIYYLLSTDSSDVQLCLCESTAGDYLGPSSWTWHHQKQWQSHCCRHLFVCPLLYPLGTQRTTWPGFILSVSVCPLGSQRHKFHHQGFAQMSVVAACFLWPRRLFYRECILQLTSYGCAQATNFKQV